MASTIASLFRAYSLLYSRDKLKLNKTAQTGSIRDAAGCNSRANICRTTNALHLRAHKWWLRGQKGEHREYILRTTPPWCAPISFFPTSPPLLPPLRPFAVLFRYSRSFVFPSLTLSGLFAPCLSSIIPLPFLALLSFLAGEFQRLIVEPNEKRTRDGYTMTSHNVRIMNVTLMEWVFRIV